VIPLLKSGMNDHEDALNFLDGPCVFADELCDQNSCVISEPIPPAARSSIHRT
jgi:hypothetical protein